MESEKAKKHYTCSICGYSPQNTATWCALGCGSDYKEMIEVPIILKKAEILTEFENMNVIEKEDTYTAGYVTELLQQCHIHYQAECQKLIEQEREKWKN